VRFFGSFGESLTEEGVDGDRQHERSQHRGQVDRIIAVAG
jgi:hypothetical protein